MCCNRLNQAVHQLILKVCVSDSMSDDQQQSITHQLRAWHLLKIMMFNKMASNTMCTTMKYEFFLQNNIFISEECKEEVYSKYIPQLVTSFLLAPQAVPIRIFPLRRKPFTEPFFHIYRQTKTLFRKCVTHHCQQVLL